jgi:quercetin dioxygenase-like cupin family protein
MSRKWLLTCSLALVALPTVTMGAFAQEATPPAMPAPSAVETEVLVDAIVEGMAGGHSRVTAERWTFRPGPAAFTQTALDGPVLVAVGAGTLVATIGDAEQRLVAGEHAVMPAGQDFALRNPEAAQAVAFQVSLVPTLLADYSFDPLYITYEDPIDLSTDGMPAGTVRVVLTQVTLPPGASLPPYEATALDWVGVMAGRLGLTLEGEGLPFRWRSGTEREFGRLQALPILTPGWRVTLRNAGEEPLVLYRLTITSGGAGTPTTGGAPVGTPPS